MTKDIKYPIWDSLDALSECSHLVYRIKWMFLDYEPRTWLYIIENIDQKQRSLIIKELNKLLDTMNPAIDAIWNMLDTVVYYDSEDNEKINIKIFADKFSSLKEILKSKEEAHKKEIKRMSIEIESLRSYNKICDEKKLDSIWLPRKIQIRLMKEGIVTVEDVTKLKLDKLLVMRWIWKHSADIIVECLRKNWLSLRK